MSKENAHLDGKPIFASFSESLLLLRSTILSGPPELLRDFGRSAYTKIGGSLLKPYKKRPPQQLAKAQQFRRVRK